MIILFTGEVLIIGYTYRSSEWMQDEQVFRQWAVSHFVGWMSDIALNGGHPGGYLLLPQSHLPSAFSGRGEGISIGVAFTEGGFFTFAGGC